MQHDVFFPMDPSNNLFSFRFFPIHSSEEFDDPSGHNLFLVMGWFWRLCPALWKVQMLPLEKQRCLKSVRKKYFFNSVKKMVLNCIFLLKYIF